MKRLTRLIDHKMARGKHLQAVLLLVLQRLLTPTPAMGFILGAVTSVFITPLVVVQMGDRPLVYSMLIAGVLVVLLSVVFQKAHDNYWERHE